MSSTDASVYDFADESTRTDETLDMNNAVRHNAVAMQQLKCTHTVVLIHSLFSFEVQLLSIRARTTKSPGCR